jgi:hypothetical protein
MMLTPRQIQILRWLDENPSHKAAWLVDGHEPRKGESHEQWNQFKIEGCTGSILVALADNKALHDFIVGCPTPDKIYGPNEKGKQILRATNSDPGSPVMTLKDTRK